MGNNCCIFKSAVDLEIERIKNMSDEEFLRTHHVAVCNPDGTLLVLSPRRQRKYFPKMKSKSKIICKRERVVSFELTKISP